MSAGDEQSKAHDGKVTLNEFCDYYSNVSASIGFFSDIKISGK